MGRKRLAANGKLAQYVHVRAGGILELRFPVPADLREAFRNSNGKPPSHIIRSLGTTDVRLANAKADALKSDLRKEFMKVRQQRQSGTLQDYLQRLYDEELAEFHRATELKRRADLIGDRGWMSVGTSPASRAPYAKALSAPDIDERRAAAGWAADRFFADRGEVVAPNSAEYQAVLDACAAVLVDTLVAAEDLDAGRPEPKPLSTQLRAATKSKVELPNALTSEGGLPLSEYFEVVYVKALTTARGPQKGERNIPGKRHAVRLFREVFGDKAVGAITKGDLWTFLDNLTQLPDPRSLSASIKKLPAPELIEWAKTHGTADLLSEKTANKHLSGIVSILKHAEKRRHIDKADVDRVKAEVIEDGPTGRSFTTDELNRIFSLPIFAGCAGDDAEAGVFKKGDVLIRDDRFWIPLLLLFTGARSSEVVGLLAGEVDVDHETPHIVIQPNAIRRLKNTHSRRMVPLHFRILDLGFAGFVRRRLMTDGADGRLFPMAIQEHYIDGATGESFAKALSSSLILRQFNRTHLEHADARKDRGSIKCFRNSFEQESSSRIKSDEVRQRLTGRKVVSTARIYVDNIPYDLMQRRTQLKHLKEEIDRITFDGVNFDHLDAKL